MMPFAALRLRKAAGGGGGGGGGSHRYWRVRTTARPGSTTRIGVIWFNTVAGVNTTPSGGTIIESSHLASFIPDNAFDNDYNNEWITLDNPGFIGYDYGAPVTLVEYVLGTANGPDMPTAFELQSSDNGTTWTTVNSQTVGTWAASTPYVFTI